MHQFSRSLLGHSIQVIVERWVTSEEYDALLEQRKLAWQPTREEEERERSRAATAEQGDGDSSMHEAENAEPNPAQAKERGIYYASGVGTPLRTHSGLASRVSSPSSLNKASNSPSAYSSLASGRLRLPSSASNPRLSALASGSPARSWSASHAKRLIEDEEAARAERERRRKASIMLGGEEEVKAIEAAEPEAKRQKAGAEGKIKLADYGIDTESATEAKTTPAVSVPAEGSRSCAEEAVLNALPFAGTRTVIYACRQTDSACRAGRGSSAQLLRWSR